MTCGLENDIRNMASFTRALESLKIGILMESFNPKLKNFELKIHRGVICHDNEEWCKLWGGIDLSFQRWHEKFDKLWSEYLKGSKMFILMRFFWENYIFFELKKYRLVIFHETEEGFKIWREIDLGVKIDIKNLTNFDLNTRKSQKFSL